MDDQGSDSPIAKFVTEEQDPAQVAKVYERLQPLLTSGERVLYIAVQKPVTVDLSPDVVVLTNRRFMHYKPSMFGRAEFRDYIWRDLKEAQLTENVFRSTISLQAANGDRIVVDDLVKAQARRLYSIAQEMEENVREELRMREMEEKRAAAGGIVLQGATPQQAAEDPMQALAKLKQLADAGLITTDEYEAKKKEILARL
jgi:hypothetical protein